MKRFWVVGIAIALMWTLLFGIGGAGTAQSHSKLSSDLWAQVSKGGRHLQRLIVQMYDMPTSEDVGYARSLNGKVQRVLTRVNALVVDLPVSNATLLARSQRVKWISPDRPVRAAMAWENAATRADVAWTTYGVSGAGVGVAILDTGVYPHEDLGNRVVAWQDFVNHQPSLMDDNGHGTHVAGIVAGNGAASIAGNYSVRFNGVAPGAHLIGVKVLDANGAGAISNVIAGIDWCIANKDVFNIRVINLSLGLPVQESYLTDPLCQACERAYQAGIVVVVAAGNGGRSDPADPNSAPAYMSIDSPGNDPDVITVGATNTKGTLSPSDDGMASYSGKAPSRFDHLLKPDLVAPGNRVVSLLSPGSALHNASPQNEVNPATYSGSGAVRYFTLSGTSMAAAMVSGAVALMLERDPTLTPDTIKARLMASANKAVYNRDGTPANIFVRGAGQLDIAAALARTETIIGGAAWSPLATRGTQAGLFLLTALPGIVPVPEALWLSSEPLSDSDLFGADVNWTSVEGPHGFWSDSLLWSDDLLWSDIPPSTDDATPDALTSHTLSVGDP